MKNFSQATKSIIFFWTIDPHSSLFRTMFGFDKTKSNVLLTLSRLIIIYACTNESRDKCCHPRTKVGEGWLRQWCNCKRGSCRQISFHKNICRGKFDIMISIAEDELEATAIALPWKTWNIEVSNRHNSLERVELRLDPGTVFARIKRAS